jgi:hypothetical protein
MDSNFHANCLRRAKVNHIRGNIQVLGGIVGGAISGGWDSVSAISV